MSFLSTLRDFFSPKQPAQPIHPHDHSEHLQGFFSPKEAERPALTNPFVTPITDDFVEPYKDKTPPWGFNGLLGYAVYKRTYARPVLDEFGHVIRTEEWWETLQRVVNGAQAIGANLTVNEARRLFDYMFNLKGLVGGRMLWQLGTPNVERFGADSLVNCWFTNITHPRDFGWPLERLMLGGGVGFAVDRPEDLGAVRQGKVWLDNAPDAGFIVPDSREGWAELVVRTLQAYLGGEHDPQEFSYSVAMIRPHGTPIKTFGGTASGPSILVEGIQDICNVLDGAVNRYLTATEVLDIGNIIGKVVVSGNVRRSAEIALGSFWDEDYLAAKRWDLGDIPQWRAMSNNSVYLPPDSVTALPDAFWEGYNGNGEPYGLFNLETSQQYGRTGEERQDITISGTNPCGEIGLAHHESCNLAEIFLPNVDSQEEFNEIAGLLYKVQKAVAAMPYLDRVSNMITSRNMRLGLAVGGVAQATETKLGWLDPGYRFLRSLDEAWSEKMGWPTSIRLTTVKPSGTISLLAGVTPGIHAGYSQFHIRRVRMAANDPVAAWCKEVGVPWEYQRNYDKSEDTNTLVFEFPCSFPEETMTADKMSAIDQLDLQRRIQAEWADNAVSTTVTFSPEELPAIKMYLLEHWPTMKSVSFLRYENHGFDQAPLQPIGSREYEERLAAIDVNGYTVGMGESFLGDDEACAGGACPIR